MGEVRSPALVNAPLKKFRTGRVPLRAPLREPVRLVSASGPCVSVGADLGPQPEEDLT